MTLWFPLMFGLAGCGKPADIRAPGEVHVLPDAVYNVKFETKDGTTISGYLLAAKGDKGVVLLHMWDKDATTWQPHLKAFLDQGITVLAPDGIGFGGSNERKGSHIEPQRDITDEIDAAIKYVSDRYATHIGIAGASYGANNALRYAAKHPEIKAIALLSPGKDYFGLQVADAAKEYKGDALVLFAKNDSLLEGGPSIIKAGMGDRAEMVEQSGSNHGTDMLTDRAMLDRLVQFFEEKLK